MHIFGLCQKDTSKGPKETAPGLRVSTDRRAPPSHPASSVSPGIPPRQGPSSLTDEVFQPGERERGRSLWLTETTKKRLVVIRVHSRGGKSSGWPSKPTAGCSKTGERRSIEG